MRTNSGGMVITLGDDERIYSPSTNAVEQEVHHKTISSADVHSRSGATLCAATAALH